MYEKAAFVFWTTLGLYLVTLFTVTYVGVYLTYIAIPFITLSGLVMLIAKPAAKTQQYIDESKRVASNTLSAVQEGINVLDAEAEKQVENTKAKLIEVKKERELKIRSIIMQDIARKKQKAEEAKKMAKDGRLSYDSYIRLNNSIDEDVVKLSEALDKSPESLISFFESKYLEKVS